MNKHVRGAHVTHDLGFLLAAHCAQANCRRDQQDGGHNHDCAQAQGCCASGTQDSEQGFNDLTLVTDLRHASGPGELLLDHGILLGVDQLDAERELEHVRGGPLGQCIVAVQTLEVLVGLFLRLLIHVSDVGRHLCRRQLLAYSVNLLVCCLD